MDARGRGRSRGGAGARGRGGGGGARGRGGGGGAHGRGRGRSVRSLDFSRAGPSTSPPPATSASETSLPPHKSQTTKTSPTRVPCPLLPGVPEIPPPRILQDWQKKKESLPLPQELQPEAASGPSRYVGGCDDDDDFNESSVNTFSHRRPESDLLRI